MGLDFFALRRQAKELARDARKGDAAALNFLAAHAPGVVVGPLATAQLAVARSVGQESWTKLKSACQGTEAQHLFAALGEGKTEAVKEILRAFPELAQARTEHGETALHTAVFTDNPDLARVLVRAGVPLGATYGSSAHTALSWSITVGSFEFARALVEAGDKPDLFCAAGLGDLAQVQGFWRNGSLIAHPSKTGSSRFTETGERLPRPPEKDSDQVSDALYIASRHGRLEVATYLLDKGADPNFRGYMGGTALHWAEFSGDPELPRILRQNGADDALLDYELLATPAAFGPICLAAFGMVEKLRERLDRDPSAVDIRGGYGTPLNAAAWNDQLGVAKLLIERGARLDERNAAGLTPLEVAQHRGFLELAHFLEHLSS